MLVLSRSPSQSIVIDGTVEVYTKAVSSDSVDLVIVGLRGFDVHRHTIHLNQSIELFDEVLITLVRIRDSKARLGIDAPRGTTIHRGEVSD